MKAGDLVRYRNDGFLGEYDYCEWYGPALLLSYDKLMKTAIVLNSAGDKIHLRAEHVQKLGRRGVNKT